MEAAVAARGARRWRWCAAVAQRRGGARWQRWRDSGVVIEALNGPLPTAGATVAADGGDAAGAAATAAGASSVIPNPGAARDAPRTSREPGPPFSYTAVYEAIHLKDVSSPCPYSERAPAN